MRPICVEPARCELTAGERRVSEIEMCESARCELTACRSRQRSGIVTDLCVSRYDVIRLPTETVGDQGYIGEAESSGGRCGELN